MKRDMDKITFESRAEINDILRAIERLVGACPQEKDNKTLMRLYGLLDIMDIEW